MGKAVLLSGRLGWAGKKKAPEPINCDRLVLPCIQFVLGLCQQAQVAGFNQLVETESMLERRQPGRQRRAPAAAQCAGLQKHVVCRLAR